MQLNHLIFRKAVRTDLVTIVAMLADDPLGSKRECFTDPLPDSYYQAFEAIESDTNNELIVTELEGKVVGVLQMTFIPYLNYQGGWRALVETVHVSAEHRSKGIGHKFFEWVIDRARQRGCYMVQLTSNKTRPDAIRFYQSLGFVASHEGLKLHLGRKSDAS